MLVSDILMLAFPSTIFYIIDLHAYERYIPNKKHGTTYHLYLIITGRNYL